MSKSFSRYGVVISIGSGVVSIQGFLNAFVGEVFKAASGPSDLSYSYGIVVIIVFSMYSLCFLLGRKVV